MVNHPTPILLSTLALLGVIGLSLGAGTTESQQTSSATSTSIGQGSSTFTGSTGPSTVTPTTSANAARPWIHEGFEINSGPYRASFTNATVEFSSERAHEGARSLKVQCAQSCGIQLLFNMEGWLTYEAYVHVVLASGSSNGDVAIYSGSVWSVQTLRAPDQNQWTFLRTSINQCVPDVRIHWHSQGPATVFLDEIGIEYSSTTSSPTRSGTAPCSGGPSACNDSPTYTTSPSPVSTSPMATSHGPSSPATTGPTTYTTSAYSPGCTPTTYPYCTGCPTTSPTTTNYCDYASIHSTTCYATPSASTQGPATVTVTQTVSAVPNLAAPATIGILVVAAAISARRLR
jgi:hypothetical protein